MERRIQVCMGSACHIKGAPLVAQALQTELEKRQANGDVLFELFGAFCQSECRDGVVVRVNGEVYKHVTPADVPRLISICLQED